ncbi:MAG: glycosyltransferase [Saprospiraceae bacterium]|jgi:glycosyltransferase involved in cell wall biosynthesis|nr:glycosyltransferase [Saprospiraceae bacterium]MDG1435952.1 glycosyltransferase [Saprospiraceae bacterium]MDG2419965.1 glycosyltransferase [Saprospiraceae bacterium]
MEKKKLLKRVLIITYYWVPMGGSGVQRWVKFSKYLPENGWQPVIYTPSNPDFPLRDESFLKDVPECCEIIRQPIWEPYRIASLFSKKKNLNTGMLRKGEKTSWKDNFLNFVRSNYFIPDPRVFWVKKSIKFLTNYLHENPVDVIVTNGPPHSMHLIGLGLKKKLGIRWIADFRDPWTNIDFYHALKLTNSSDQKHRALEKEVVRTADIVTVVGKSMQEEYLEYSDHVKVITNGYDQSISPKKVKRDNKFSIAHIGLMNADRNPKMLWKVLNKIGEEQPGFLEDLNIKLIGKVSENVLNTIEENYLTNQLELIDYVPHNEVHILQQTSQILLLVVNDTPNAKGILTGKIFEYLMARRPILAIAPEDGDLAEIINQTESGEVFGFLEMKKLEIFILKSYADYKNGSLEIKSHSIEMYNRQNLTKEMVALF